MQRAARMDGVDSKTQFSKGIGSRIGTSFSDADLRLATKYNLKGIRARTANYVFNIERTGKSWNVSADQIQREWRKAYNKYSSQVQRVASRSRDWNMSRVYQGRAEALISHQATKDVAKMFGLKYTRRKIK